MEIMSEKEAINIAKSFIESDADISRFQYNHSYLIEEDNPYWVVHFLYLDEDGNIVMMDPSAFSVFVNCSTGEASIPFNF